MKKLVKGTTKRQKKRKNETTLIMEKQLPQKMNNEKEIHRNKTNQKGNMHLRKLSHTKPIRVHHRL